MKKCGPRQLIFYAWAEWVYVGAILISSFVGWVNGVEKNDAWVKNRTILWSLIEDVQSSTFYVYIFLGVVISVCFVYRRLGDPWVVSKLKVILDQYQYKIFSENGAPADHDRVTLFKHTEKCLFVRHWSSEAFFKPWGNCPYRSNYLVPFLRSGHLSQNTKAIFYAPDDSDKAEGVAALAWAKRRAVIQQDLPDLKKTSGDHAIRKYSKLTNSYELMVRKYLADGKTLPRSIAAIPIESGGKIWGVLVLDSRSPKGVTDESVNNYQLTIALIGQLLEKV